MPKTRYTGVGTQNMPESMFRSPRPPKPYLVNVPERDIRTPSGRPLTLLNHAYMIRQVYEMDQTGPEGHLVAFYPLDPKNLPDAWESQALKSFAA